MYKTKDKIINKGFKLYNMQGKDFTAKIIFL